MTCFNCICYLEGIICVLFGLFGFIFPDKFLDLYGFEKGGDIVMMCRWYAKFIAMVGGLALHIGCSVKSPEAQKSITCAFVIFKALGLAFSIYSCPYFEPTAPMIRYSTVGIYAVMGLLFLCSGCCKCKNCKGCQPSKEKCKCPCSDKTEKKKEE